MHECNKIMLSNIDTKEFCEIRFLQSWLMLLSRGVTFEICQLLVVSCQRGPFSQSLVSERVQELTSSLFRRLMTSDEMWRRIGLGNTRDMMPDTDNQ